MSTTSDNTLISGISMKRNFSEEESGMESMAIEMEGLYKSYNGTKALQNLSCQIPYGCIFGFLGPNGAGKSTTIRCLSGLLYPDSGHIRMLGMDFHRDEVKVKLRIGVVPENLGLLDDLKVMEMLLFQASMYGMESLIADERAHQLMRLLSLDDAKNRRIRDLSTGMQRKAAFAVAVIHNPELLLLDEPFEGVDPASAALMKEWLRQYVAKGRTVFLTTHVLEVVERLCDKIAILKNGSVVWTGVSSSSFNGGLVYKDHTYQCLEDLFIAIAEQPFEQLDWL